MPSPQMACPPPPRSAPSRQRRLPLPVHIEWPTVAMILGCYGLWGAGLFWLPGLSVAASVMAVALSVTLHASLTHEVIHGHPTRWRALNAALVAPALSLVVPYGRFRDTHLAHHMDAVLTDPYDDPESNYLDPAVWAGLSPWLRGLLRLNNSLAGRMVLGPVLGQAAFMAADLRAIRAGDGGVLRAWLWHLPAVAPVLALASLAQSPTWAFALGTYLGLSILKIRTFLEHRAHAAARARTVIIEDRGLLALLFLNNNLHVVHHMHPRVPWYRLPALYHGRAAHYLARNQGYRYRSYGDVFRRYLWRAKDPVPHPLYAAGPAAPGASAPDARPRGRVG